MIFTLILSLGSVTVDAPQIVGDSSLFEVVKAARRANFDRLREGELIVSEVIAFVDDASPVVTASIHSIWKGDAAYFEFTETSYGKYVRFNGGSALPRTPESMSITYRIVLDATRCITYRTPHGYSAGELFIDAAKDFGRRVGRRHLIDQRPAHQWEMLFGMYRPLEEMIGPHPNFPTEGIKTWAVSEAAGKVAVVRTDEVGGNTSDVRMVFDLNLAGNLVTFAGSGGSKAELEWEKRPDGVVVLRKAKYFEAIKNGRQAVRITKVEKLDLAPSISSTLFTLEGLRVRPGARAEDRITGRAYSYGGRPVTQTDLDKLIDAGKKGRDGERKP
jgi:hypothetical protein